MTHFPHQYQEESHFRTKHKSTVTKSNIKSCVTNPLQQQIIPSFRRQEKKKTKSGRAESNIQRAECGVYGCVLVAISRLKDDLWRDALFHGRSLFGRRHEFPVSRRAPVGTRIYTLRFIMYTAVSHPPKSALTQLDHRTTIDFQLTDTLPMLACSSHAQFHYELIFRTSDFFFVHCNLSGARLLMDHR